MPICVTEARRHPTWKLVTQVETGLAKVYPFLLLTPIYIFQTQCLWESQYVKCGICLIIVQLNNISSCQKAVDVSHGESL